MFASLSVCVLGGGALFTCYHRNLTFVSHAADRDFRRPSVPSQQSFLRKYATFRGEAPTVWKYNWDGKENQTRGCADKHLVFIRHGQYYDCPGYDESQKVLTPYGTAQAQEVGKYLSRLHRNLGMPLTKVVFSTMTRAKQTGEIAMRAMNCRDSYAQLSDMRIRESGPVIYNNLPYYDHTEEKVKTLLEAVHEKFDLAFNDYFVRSSSNEPELQIFFCHANIIRYYFTRAIQVSGQRWKRLSLNHCSVTHFTIKPNGYVLCNSYGDTGFMPRHLVTSLNEKNPPSSGQPSCSRRSGQ